jgi:GNAT superfamily N-acetyltransferase
MPIRSACNDLITTRHASVEDAAAIARIYVDAWRSAYANIVPDTYLAGLSFADRHSYYSQVIVNGIIRVLVTSIGGTVAGWAALGPDRDEADSPALEIQAIYVAPEHWGCGLGRALFDMIEYEAVTEGCYQLSLWVLAKNERGLRFYRALGFIKVAEKVIDIGGCKLVKWKLERH